MYVRFFPKGKTYYAATDAPQTTFYLPRNLIGPRHFEWRISIELGRTCPDTTWRIRTKF